MILEYSFKMSGANEDQFIQNLVLFNRSRGVNGAKPDHFVVRINGQRVSLSELFALIQEYGGYNKVNLYNSWDEIFSKLFKTNEVGLNFAAALRQIYNRYLYQYEKSLTNDGKNNGRDDRDVWNNEEEEDENLFSRVNSVSQPWLYKDRIDVTSILNAKSGHAHDYSKLYNSMLSTLSNEMGFALNMSTLLSNDDEFDWQNDYKFVNCILNMLKNYVCVCNLEEELLDFGRTEFGDDFEVRRVCLIYQLQMGLISPESVHDALSGRSTKKDDKSEEDLTEEEQNPLFNKKVSIIERRCNCFRQLCQNICHDDGMDLIFQNDNNDYDEELTFVKFGIGEVLLTRMRNRLKRLAELLLHISDSFNINAEKQGKPQMLLLMKFLILLIRSKHQDLYSLGIQIMANISPLLSFVDIEGLDEYWKDLLTCLLKSCVDCFLKDPQDQLASYAIEALSSYIGCENSEANYLLETQFDTEKMISILAKRFVNTNDVVCTITMLEYCLIVSESRANWFIKHDMRHLTDIFVNFLNCEESSRFSQSSLKSLNVIDYRDAGVVASMLAQKRSNQQAHSSEQFAVQYMQNTFLEHSGFSVKVDDLYQDYYRHSLQTGKQFLFPLQGFSQLLTRVFPAIRINSSNLIEGLRFRNVSIVQSNQLPKTTSITVQLPSGPKYSMVSPILKAQLSAPPKADSPQPPATQAQQSQTLVSAPVSVPTSTVATIMQPQMNSNLIKSLLANKLKNGPTSTSTDNPSQSTQIQTSIQQPPSQTVTVQAAPHQQLQQPQIIHVSQASSATGVVQTPTSATALVGSQQNSLQGNTVFIGNSNSGQSGQIFVLRAPVQGSNQRVNLILSARPPQNNPLLLTQQLNRGGMQLQIMSPQQPSSGVQGNATVVTAGSLGQIQRPQLSQLVQQQKTVQVQMIQQGSPIVTSMIQQHSQQQSTMNNQLPTQILQQNATGNVMIQQQQHQQIPQNNLHVNQAGVNSVPQPQLNSNPQIQTNMNQTQGLQQRLPQTIQLVQTSTGLKPIQMIQQPLQNNVRNQQPQTFQNSISLPPLQPQQHQSVSKPVSSNPMLNVLLEKGILPEENFSSSGNEKPMVNGICNNINNLNPKRIVEENHIADGDLKKIKIEIRQNSCDTMQPRMVPPSPQQPQSQPRSAIVQQVANTFPAQTLTQVLQAPTITQISHAPTRIELSLRFECEWFSCNYKYAKPQQLWYHIYNDHIKNDPSPSGTCLWGGPDGKGPGCRIRRPKCSLLTHVHENHGNLELLKQQTARKEEIRLKGASHIPPPPIPSEHPGYPNDAAMNSIKRHYAQDNLTHSATGAVSTSIRLTSALILRNLTQKSASFKKILGLYEGHLVQIACSDREESRTIAQVLSELSHK